MSTEIQHDPSAHRFSTNVDGHVGYVEYELRGDNMAITHTVVPPAIGGRGIAGHLVQAAMDHARGAGMKVHPQCSYADAWLGRHPEYAGLRA